MGNQADARKTASWLAGAPATSAGKDAEQPARADKGKVGR